LGENNEESDSEGGRKDQSTREMNYEALMVCLGKKTLKTKQAERKKLQEEQAQREEYDNQRMPGDSMQDWKPDGDGGSQAQLLGTETQGGSSRRKGARQMADATDMNYESNAAMRYRAAKASPKAVEVWMSKIHRNGLFAC